MPFSNYKLEYLSDNNFLLNPVKAKYLLFTSRKIPESIINANIFINKYFFEEVYTIKYLGSVVDNNNLSWTFHRDFVCNRELKQNIIYAKEGH